MCIRDRFSGRRKKLRSSIAAGLALERADAEALLARADISPDLRAQDLSLEDWMRLAAIVGQDDVVRPKDVV